MTTVEGEVLDPTKVEPGVVYLGMYLTEGRDKDKPAKEGGWWVVCGRHFESEAQAVEDLRRWSIDTGKPIIRFLVVKVRIPEV